MTLLHNTLSGEISSKSPQRGGNLRFLAGFITQKRFTKKREEFESHAKPENHFLNQSRGHHHKPQTCWRKKETSLAKDEQSGEGRRSLAKPHAWITSP